jgi:long-chain acyl-CoA synthetase
VLSPHAGDGSGVVKELGTEPLNGLWASPGLLEQLSQQAVACPWTRLKLCLSVGGSVSDATADAWRRWSGHTLGELYGLAEAGPFVAGRLPGAPGDRRQGLQPLPGTDVIVLGADDGPLPCGEVGELTVRGPQVMAGYWQRPDETARVTTALGSLRTGDLADIDSQGGLRIMETPGRGSPVIGVTCLPPMSSKVRWA